LTAGQTYYLAVSNYPYPSGNTYTGNFTVTVTPPQTTYTVSTNAGAGGQIYPTSVTVNVGSTYTFGVYPSAGNAISSVSGCGGIWTGSNSNSYTTGAITGNCTVTATFNTPTQPCSTAAVASTTAACAWNPSVQATYTSGTVAGNSGQYWIKITPTTSGTWTFTSSKPATNPLSNPHGMLFQSNGTTLIANDDDSAGDLQFRLSAALTAGQTYYLKVNATSYMTGNFTVTATRQ